MTPEEKQRTAQRTNARSHVPRLSRRAECRAPGEALGEVANNTWLIWICLQVVYAPILWTPKN